MKRALAISLLGIAATANTVQGQGAIVFNNYMSPYVPIVYDASVGVDPGRAANSGFSNVVHTTDGVQIEVWWAPGTGLDQEDLVFGANAQWSPYDGFTSAWQAFTIWDYWDWGWWTMQLRASGTIAPVGGAPVDTVRSRGPLIETDEIGDQGLAGVPELPGYVRSPGFSVYRVCTDGPPTIWRQPTAQTAEVGLDVEIAVLTGEDPCSMFSYQWQVDQSEIPGATNRILSIPNAEVADSGHYRVAVTRTVTNAVTVVSEEAALQVLPPGAPSTRVDGRIAVGEASSVASAEIAFLGGFSAGAIFYTLDGSTPTTNSIPYSTPFSINASATVQAMSLSADSTQAALTQPVFVFVLPVYPLVTGVSGEGSIDVAPSSSTYPSNTVVALRATASPYWAFDHWSGDLSGSDNPTAIDMDRPKSVEAVFVQTHYPVTVSTAGGGVVTVNGQPNSPLTYYLPGTALTLEAIPTNGWSFLGWQGTVESSGLVETLTVAGTNIVHANFGTEVVTNVLGRGRIALSASNPVPYGTVLEATAIPEPGHYLLSWGGSVSDTNNPIVLDVTHPTPQLSALFLPVPTGTYTLNTYLNGEGRIVLDPSQPFYMAGSTVTLSASATSSTNPFVGWTGDGSGTADRLVVTLDDNKVIDANFVSWPVASLRPTNLVVVKGSSAVMTAGGAGSPPLHYQWQKESSPIPGATNAPLTLSEAQAADAGFYSVVVCNPLGAATSQVATVTIVFPPEITLDPFSQNLPVGDSLTLTVLADGTPPIGFQWYRDSVEVADATNSSLLVDPLRTNDTGGYSVVGTNAHGSTTSSVASVFAYIPVDIVAPPVSQIAPAYTTVEFGVVADGFPEPSYQWYFEGGLIPGATLSTLTISNLSTRDVGQYHVVVRNAYSSKISPPATLTLSPTLAIPFVGATPSLGQDALLSVRAVGSGDLNFQWYKDGVAIGGATNDTLSIPNVQSTNAGLYSVGVSNRYGAVTSTPALLVVNPTELSMGLYAGLTLTGAAGNAFAVEYTTDVTDSNSWRLATNLTLPQEVELWVDEGVEVQEQPTRVYRVLPGP